MISETKLLILSSHLLDITEVELEEQLNLLSIQINLKEIDYTEQE